MSNRDITERKRIEEILKQRTKDLERSNKDLEQFAYVAAHDLREPLVAVASYLKVLEKLLKNPVEDNVRKCVIKAMNLVLYGWTQCFRGYWLIHDCHLPHDPMR